MWFQLEGFHAGEFGMTFLLRFHDASIRDTRLHTAGYLVAMEIQTVISMTAPVSRQTGAGAAAASVAPHVTGSAAPRVVRQGAVGQHRHNSILLFVPCITFERCSDFVVLSQASLQLLDG